MVLLAGAIGMAIMAVVGSFAALYLKVRGMRRRMHFVPMADRRRLQQLGSLSAVLVSAVLISLMATLLTSRM